MSSYFKNFPVVNYPRVGPAKNIAARAVINMKDKSTIDYVLPGPLRPDTIAARYYNDQNLDWAIYLANDVVDPYYEMYLDTETLHKMIEQRYGTLEAAAQTIVFWKSNWQDNPEPITVAVYNSLPADVKPLFNAQTNGMGTVTSYVRKRHSIIRTTNMIARYSTASAIDVDAGDLVEMGESGAAQVITADADTITVQHIIGEDDVDEINGVAVEQLFVQTSISDTEAAYFSAVSAYEAAVAANERRRSIRLVPATSAEVLRKELKRVLR